jgi:excisionase family DNA binding protein
MTLYGWTESERHTRLSCAHVIPLAISRKGSPMPGTTWSEVKFLTIYEIATMMRISKMSAYRLIHSGELEAIRVGRSYRVPEQAVISYMREAAYTPAAVTS